MGALRSTLDGDPAGRLRGRLAWAVSAAAAGLCLTAWSLSQPAPSAEGDRPAHSGPAPSGFAVPTDPASPWRARKDLETHLTRKVEHLLRRALGPDAFAVAVTAELASGASPSGAELVVRRLTVGVTVDDRRSVEDLAKIEAMVRNAVGATDSRGDVIEIVGFPFASASIGDVMGPSLEPSWVRPGVLAAGLALLLLSALLAARAWIAPVPVRQNRRTAPETPTRVGAPDASGWAGVEPQTMAELVAAFATRED